MKISVIFPTYQRSKDLKVALDSLLEQKLLPFETIVVDQSDDDLTKNLCSEKKYEKIWIKYIYSDCKSPPKAKQIWMDAMSDKVDTFIFFDDDVKVMPNYLSEVEKFLEDNPDALWWGWKILNFPNKKNIIQDLWYFFFRRISISHEFSTIDAQYKNQNCVQNVTSMIWCNMFYRRKVKDLWYKFVDWMKRYWHCDDTFFAYQIYNDYPSSLFYIPWPEVYHYESPAWRILKIQWFKQVLYHRYIFWKTYKFSMWQYYWWCFWFLGIQCMKSDNKCNIIKTYFKTMKIIRKKWKTFVKNPNAVNEFIYNDN